MDTLADFAWRWVLVPQTVATREPPRPYMLAGTRALALTAEIVALGPRLPGSEAHQLAGDLLASRFLAAGCPVSKSVFVADTPKGPVPMTNIIARHRVSRRARSEREPALAVVSGHYDTLDKPGFVGANDGAATAGALVELCSLLQGQQLGFETWLVLFDGEEPFERWSAGDHTYGSRQLASEWARDGTLERVGALINIDMIADKRLGLMFESASTPWLRSRVWGVAHSLGYLREFREVNVGFVADDHLEFLKYGVAGLELIDLDYGFMNRFWHTDNDRVDNLSARSIAVTLHVLVETLASMDTEGFEPRG